MLSPYRGGQDEGADPNNLYDQDSFTLDDQYQFQQQQQQQQYQQQQLDQQQYYNQDHHQQHMQQQFNNQDQQQIIQMQTYQNNNNVPVQQQQQQQYQNGNFNQDQQQYYNGQVQQGGNINNQNIVYQNGKNQRAKQQQVQYQKNFQQQNPQVSSQSQKIIPQQSVQYILNNHIKDQQNVMINNNYYHQNQQQQIQQPDHSSDTISGRHDSLSENDSSSINLVNQIRSQHQEDSSNISSNSSTKLHIKGKNKNNDSSNSPTHQNSYQPQKLLNKKIKKSGTCSKKEHILNCLYCQENKPKRLQDCPNYIEQLAAKRREIAQKSRDSKKMNQQNLESQIGVMTKIIKQLIQIIIQYQFKTQFYFTKYEENHYVKQEEDVGLLQELRELNAKSQTLINDIQENQVLQDSMNLNSDETNSLIGGSDLNMNDDIQQVQTKQKAIINTQNSMAGGFKLMNGMFLITLCFCIVNFAGFIVSNSESDDSQNNSYSQTSLDNGFLPSSEKESQTQSFIELSNKYDSLDQSGLEDYEEEFEESLGLHDGDQKGEDLNLGNLLVDEFDQIMDDIRNNKDEQKSKGKEGDNESDDSENQDEHQDEGQKVNDFNPDDQDEPEKSSKDNDKSSSSTGNKNKKKNDWSDDMDMDMDWGDMDDWDDLDSDNGLQFFPNRKKKNKDSDSDKN